MPPVRALACAVGVAGALLACAASGTAAGRVGTRIAFVGGRNSQLDVANQDGTGARRVSKLGTYSLSPKWSPVDARIAISARDIYVVDVRRSKTLRLTRILPGLHSVALSPTWSPDGRRIAFVGKGYDLYVMSSTGHDAKRLTHTNVCERDPAWSPNGRWIAYAWRCRPPSFIYVLDLRTGSRTRLSTTPGDGPAWSPDGKELAFRNGNEIRVKTLADGTERVLVQGLDMIGGPSWSPDGSKLLLSVGGNHVNCEKPETTVLQLFVYDIRADDLRRLPISSCFNELEGDWERR